MKVLALCLMLIVSVLGAHNDLTTIIALVIADTDVDGDGFISEAELNNEFLVKFDSNGDGVITKNEFLHEWTHTYLDNHHDAEIFFNNMDLNNNGMLDTYDITENSKVLDTDGDGLISVAEYEAFIRAKHPCGHGDSGC